MGQVVTERVWIPAIRLIKARTWRKTMSDAHGPGPAAVMQLVP